MKLNFKKLLQHPYRNLSILAGILLVIYWLSPKPPVETQKIFLDTAEMEDLQVTVTGYGSLIAAQDVWLTPVQSGEVNSIPFEEGDYVAAGTVLVSLTTDHEETELQKAELALQQAQLLLQQLKNPDDASDLKQAELELEQAGNNLNQLQLDYNSNLSNFAQEKSDKEYDYQQELNDAYTTVTEFFSTISGVLADLDDIVDGKNFTDNQTDLIYYYNDIGDSSEALHDQVDYITEKFNASDATFNDLQDLYLATNSSSSQEEIEALLDLAYTEGTDITETLKQVQLYLSDVKSEYSNRDFDLPAILNSQITVVDDNLNLITPYFSALQNHVQSLGSLKTDLVQIDEDISTLAQNLEMDSAEAQNAIDQKQLQLEEIQTGADEYDVEKQELEVQIKQLAVESANQAYEDKLIVAPFSGRIADINVTLGENVSSATQAVRMLSENDWVEIQLNEIEVAQVQVGQEAEIFFDALPDQSFSGKVLSQALVNVDNQDTVEYSVMVELPQEEMNENLRVGMSAEVDIITAQVENVLAISQLALTQEDDQYFVERLVGSLPETPAPYNEGTLVSEKIPVEIGLKNPLNVEIISGLKEGDLILVHVTVTADTTTPTFERQDPKGPFDN